MVLGEQTFIALVLGLLQYLPHLLVILSHGLTDCSLAFILADIGPGILNVRQVAHINSIRVCVAEFKKHLSCDEFPIQSLRLHSLEDLLTQLVHLLDELLP
jgi:hypothetical protein